MEIDWTAIAPVASLSICKTPPWFVFSSIILCAMFITVRSCTWTHFRHLRKYKKLSPKIAIFNEKETKISTSTVLKLYLRIGEFNTLTILTVRLSGRKWNMSDTQHSQWRSLCLLNIFVLHILNYSCANCYRFNRIH
jgi:hypothetical protein